MTTLAAFPHVVRRSRRAKRLSLTVYPDRRVVVTAPLRASERQIALFLVENDAWIARQLRGFEKYDGCITLPGGRRDYLRYKERARMMIHAYVRAINAVYGFEYRRISVKDLSTRWGSCSDLGNLNFNYRLVHLPAHLVSYVVTHELCHLGQLDHSPRFWELVERTVPDHKVRRRELQRYLL